MTTDTERLAEAQALLAALLRALDHESAGGYLKGMAKVRGRIAWYDRVKPDRERARAFLAHEDEVPNDKG